VSQRGGATDDVPANVGGAGGVYRDLLDEGQRAAAAARRAAGEHLVDAASDRS
jgi:hypothetical protein